MKNSVISLQILFAICCIPSVVYALDSKEQAFISAYIAAVNSKDPEKLAALTALEVKVCIKAAVSKDVLPENAEATIFPISDTTRKSLESIWPPQSNYFPVTPTHLLQIAIPPDTYQMVILAEKNDSIYIIAACSKKTGAEQ